MALLVFLHVPYTPGALEKYDARYMASYIYLTRIAKKWPDNTSKTLISYKDPSQPGYMLDDDYEGLTGVVEKSGFNGKTWLKALVVNSTKSSLAFQSSNNI